MNNVYFIIIKLYWLLSQLLGNCVDMKNRRTQLVSTKPFYVVFFYSYRRLKVHIIIVGLLFIGFI